MEPKRYVAAMLAVGVMVLAGVGGVFVWWNGAARGDDRSGPSVGERRAELTPAEFAGDHFEQRTLTVTSLTWDDEQQQTLVEVMVRPPEGAVEVLVSLDPSSSGSWLAVDLAPVELTLATPDHGYQMAFARFRDNAGRSMGAEVVGFDVDHGGTTGPPVVEPAAVGLLSPTEIVVRVEDGRIEFGSIQPYELEGRPEQVDAGERHAPIFDDSGSPIGVPVSTRPDLIRSFDRFIGTRFDVSTALQAEWTVRSDSDSRYGQAQGVAGVDVMTRPLGGGLDRDQQVFWNRQHDLVVEVPWPLASGHRYVLESTHDLMEPVVLDFEQSRTISPSIRVNQVGYAPGDDPKVAYLGSSPSGFGDLTWLDDGVGAETAGGSVGSRPVFEVRRLGSEEPVFTGTVPGPDYGLEGLGSDEGVVELDFTPVGEPGRYRVCVVGLGCSLSFDIDAGVWRRTSSVVARAAFHQRSGIELGPPHTAVRRPRGYHPADGETVEASDLSLLAARLEPGALFERLPAGTTGELVAEAWGGHFDAGDWDRRIDHLHYTRVVAELVRHHPEAFDSLRLNIPESDNPVPDLLDEGLWSLDLYRRMQLPEGAIRGGIEASEHPMFGTTSWTDDLAVYAYAPDRWSSYLYAGVAAEVAHTLRPYDPQAAEGYLSSALAAMEWAETAAIDRAAGDPVSGDPAYDDPVSDDGIPGEVDDMVNRERNVAAAALLLATGDDRWNRMFLDGSVDLFATEGDVMECHLHTVCDAAWLYLEAGGVVGSTTGNGRSPVPNDLVDADVAERFRAWFLTSADKLVAAGEGNGYGWTSEHPEVPLIWGLGAGGGPKAIGLLRAFQLSGDDRYRQTVVRSASFSLGANPLNQVFLTGIGRYPVRHPLIVDNIHGGVPLWPGTPVYGLHDLGHGEEDDWAVEYFLEPGGARPHPDDLPYLRQWYDLNSVAFFNEFTLHQSHAEALRVFASLYATQ